MTTFKMKLKRSFEKSHSGTRRRRRNMNVAGNAPGHGCLERVHIIYVCVCVSCVCIMIYCEENTHDVPSPAPASAATDPARSVCVCARDNLY
jgi:hypothetical protein